MVVKLNKAAFILIIVVSFTLAQTSDTRLYWIMLRERTSSVLNTHTNGTQLQTAAQSLGITDRALKRRAKSLPPEHLIDELDLPVSETAIAQIKQTGVKIRTISRWFNAVSIEATPQQLRILTALSIVAKVEPIAHLNNPRPMPLQELMAPPIHKSTRISEINYGSSETQLAIMKAVDLHSIAVIGLDVVIGMLDDGFNNYRTHVALKNIKVLADSDFIHNINDVNRQPWEASVQGDHGAGTLSVVGGFDNGSLIGSAFGASFILAKTEMDSSGNLGDFHSEEDTYVAALEWMERLGADITSSSLAYKDFISPPSYTAADLDGRTTKVAQAAIIAARKGVLVVTAIGNEGYINGKGPGAYHADSTLWSPADADSIIAVGATSSDKELAAFSGTGPTGDGRIKPEVVAQGMGVYWADGASTDSYRIASGTSCSTPLVAGAAALILSAHPELTAMQVRQALLNTAIHINDGTSHTLTYPNNYYGYGFVDALAAALFYGPIFSNRLLVIKTDSSYNISVWIKQSVSVRMDSVILHFKQSSDTMFQHVALLPAKNENEYVIIIPDTLFDSTATGYVTARDKLGIIWQAPSNAPTILFSLAPTPDSIMGFFPTPSNQILPIEYVLYQNYPNPFNSGTFIIFDIPVSTDIELAVFNLLGQRVKTIFHGYVPQTRISKQWDGTDEYGRHVVTGVYFARLKTPSAIRAIKMLYIK